MTSPERNSVVFSTSQKDFKLDPLMDETLVFEGNWARLLEQKLSLSCVFTVLLYIFVLPMQI